MSRSTVDLALVACFMLVGVVLDTSYQRSTPGAIHTHGTIVDFLRRNTRQVYRIFEFADENGRLHRVVNPSQQAIVRFLTGDSVPIAYSQSDPQRARIDTLWFDHRWLMGG
jgi:translation initiation factor IF-1